MSISNWTLKNKVILHVVVLGVGSALILTLLFISTQKNLISTLVRQKAELVATLIKGSVFGVQKCGRIEEAQSKIVELASATNNIQKIRIISPRAIIFASSDPTERQQALGPKEQDRVRDVLARGTPRGVLFSEPDSTVQYLALVENRAACYDCHSPQAKSNGVLEVTIDTRQAAALLRKSQWKGVVIALVTLFLLTVIILRLFERLINRPISLLKERMLRVQEGDQTLDLTPAKEDEIGSLMRSFNVMVDNLRKANRKIEDLYSQRIEKAEHLASFGELAAGLAHEIKNPLAGMKGALEIIVQKANARDTNRDIFREILAQIDKIIYVIQDFLSYAKPKPSHFALIDPDRFVENAIRLAQTQMGGKDIRFEFSGLGGRARARLDTDKMQEVMLNLLLNAIAAIERSGLITIALAVRSEDRLEIRVADNGQGIKEQNLAHIFGPFFSTKKGGTGLGLSISKRIVEEHGGTISVDSREGQGTAFVIRLPLDPAQD
jgi:signal transduction histidine kinase